MRYNLVVEQVEGNVDRWSSIILHANIVGVRDKPRLRNLCCTYVYTVLLVIYP